MNATQIDKHKAYGELRRKADEARAQVMAAIYYAVRENPDALRAAIGSVAFRKAEEYRILDDKANAAFEEWIAQ